MLKPTVGPTSVYYSSLPQDKEKKFAAETRTMTTTISDLPTDLAEEIISRIPLKCMRSVRLTCKRWDLLSKSESFTRMKIVREEEAASKERESRMIVLMDYNLYLMSVFVNQNPSTEIKGKLTCLNEQAKISRIFHCEGLLLCILRDDDTRLAVWNPYFGQTRWIETRYCYRSESFPYKDVYRYGFGYSKKNKSHRILRFFDDEVFYPTRDFLSWYEMYDFDSDSWKTLDVTPNWVIGSESVSLEGNVYWCARERNSPLGGLDRIICFDFDRERFGPLLHLPFSSKDTVFLSCVGEEKKLAVLYRHGFGIDIWITTEIEPEKMSWSRFLTLGPDTPIYQLWIGGYLVDEVKKAAVVFGKKLFYDETLNRDTVHTIGVDGGVKEMNIGETAFPSFWPDVCSYLPSSSQIKQPARGKSTKEQSSVEKRRYDQNLLRLDQHEEACRRSPS